MTRETQASISKWAEQTFGPVSKPTAVAVRLNVEVAELLLAVAHYENCTGSASAVADELADVAIMLYRLAAVLGTDLHGHIDEKMLINRDRRWELAGDGTGRHVRAGADS